MNRIYGTIGLLLCAAAASSGCARYGYGPRGYCGSWIERVRHHEYPVRVYPRTGALHPIVTPPATEPIPTPAPEMPSSSEADPLPPPADARQAPADDAHTEAVDLIDPQDSKQGV